MGEASIDRSPWGWVPELWLVTATAAVTFLLMDGILLELDLAVREWVATHQVQVLHLTARGLNFAGSANVLAVVALALAVPVLVRYRTRQAAVALLRPVVLAFGLSVLLIGPIKLWTDRAAPGDPSRDAAVLFAHPEGWSYPSGHVVNAVLWYGVLVFLLDTAMRAYARRPLPGWATLLLRLGPPVLVSATVTYLNYHWLTDTVVGILLGVLLDRLMRRVGARWPARVHLPQARHGQLTAGGAAG